MKYFHFLILFIFSIAISYGQVPVTTKEIVIDYTNGREIFEICTTGCKINFEDSKTYHWYTEFSKIKTSEGGSGGDLLHGNYKFFDKNRNLRVEKNYVLGLLNGVHKAWDSTGNLILHIKYNMGNHNYFKIFNPEDEGYWIEWIGQMLAEGSKKRIYNQFNKLSSEGTVLSNGQLYRKVFFENSGKISQEYTLSSWGKEEFLKGRFTSFYENGLHKVEGQFYDGDYTNIKVGVWRFFNPDGTLKAVEKFKSGVEFWDNGKYKIKGGYIFDDVDNTWKKNGEWIWYKEDGFIESEKKYDWDIEVE